MFIIRNIIFIIIEKLKIIIKNLLIFFFGKNLYIYILISN